jgi:D-alanyl-D-alanine carboxypeptidase (penicillin-binding protein 5/6)
MPVVTIRPRPRPKKHRARKVLAVVFVVLLGAGSWNYFRPLPVITASHIYQQTVAAEPIQLQWPNFGQAAIATSEDGVLATTDKQTPLATASIAKVITALCVLEKYPLQPGQSGPTLTLTDADVTLYTDYLAKDGSVVPVQIGEQLSEYQLLEGMLLPSGNNLADTAAIWAYGSLADYHAFANQFLATHGLTNTHVAVDASGYDGATTATASDLARLGQLVVAQPVLMEIVGKTSTDLPVAGRVYNYNWVLGKQGIVGIKTGNNDQDLGAFLFAARWDIGGKSVTVTGAVMGAGSLQQALQSTLPLLTSARQSFTAITAAAKNQPLATYTAPWGATVHAVAHKAISFVRWDAEPVSVTTDVHDLDPAHQPSSLGTVKARTTREVGSSKVQLDHPLSGPSFWWRLTRHDF